MNTPILKEISLSAVLAGLVAVLVSFASTAVLMVQAGQSAGLDVAHIGSWVGAVCLAIGIPGAWLSLKWRTPAVFAWSTAGAAMLITGLPGMPFDQAIGAFLVAAAMTLACGLLGWVDPILRRIPPEIAAAMLAGVLLHFGIGIFSALNVDTALALTMIAAYLLGRRWLPRYSIFVVLVTGLVVVLSGDTSRFQGIAWTMTQFHWTTPSFTWQATVSIAVPLFIIAMASQNLPGLAILQAAGYQPRASRSVAASGLFGMLSAPLGAHSITLAAIVAAIVSSKEAHPDPARRYWAAATYGLVYIPLSLAAGAVALFFQALPLTFVAGLAGLALIGPIMGGLTTAMATTEKREAALITLLATASGFSLWGIGSAFWGLVAGLIANAILTPRKRP